MFSPICSHVIPAHGGTRVQFSEVSFRPDSAVIRCEHCQQLIPTTIITTHRRTPHTPVGLQVSHSHMDTYMYASFYYR
jgi:hypothetical protein